MIRLQLTKIVVLLSCCLSWVVMANDDMSDIRLLRSESTGAAVEGLTLTDKSRIYLKQGAIWASRDMTRFDPVLDVTVTDAVEVADQKLQNPISFSVKTNYSYYITRWQLSIYRKDDVYYSQPLAVLSGQGLSNNQSISWAGETAQPWNFSVGSQLLYRFEAWDSAGHSDLTTTGVMDLIPVTRQAKLDKLNNDTGKVFGRASLMRHNIPTSSGMAKFIGSGLIGIDRVAIGDNEYPVNQGNMYVEQYLPTGIYDFPVNIRYNNGDEEQYQLVVDIPDRYFASTGIADLYIGKNFVSGNQDILAANHQYQGDIYNHGRLAYFAEGKYGDKLRFIAQVDTWQHELKDMFKHPFASRERAVFEILDDEDPELYYGEYGDHANIQKVVNTKGKVFLNLQYEKSDVLWGNYNTGFTGNEIASYNRSLYGFKTDLRTASTTAYGDDRAAFTAFTAEADTAFGHDEFLGTGTSVYFLRHGELIPGSDKLYIRQIDMQTHRIVDQIALQPGIDYSVDPFQGRIILTQPLSSRAFVNNQAIINNQPGGDIYNYLVVDYEYLPRDGELLSNMTYGGRLKGWLNKHIGLGATYVKEDKDQQNYDLKGADLTLRLTESSFVKAEFSASKGIQTESNFVSVDGGLTFTDSDKTSPETTAREGQMFLLNALFNFHDLAPGLFGAIGNDLGLWYKKKEAGFSYASQFDDLQQNSGGGTLRLQVSDRVQFVTRYQDSHEKNTKGEAVTDTREGEVEVGWLITDHIKWSLAGEKINELNPDRQSSHGSLVGTRLDYILDTSNLVYIKGQKTLEHSNSYQNNDSITVGMQTILLPKVNLAGDYTAGDRGNTTQLTVGYESNSYHNTYMTWLSNQYEGKNNLVFGQKGRLSEHLSAFQENQFVDENNGKGRIDSFGFDYIINDFISSGLSFQQGKIHNLVTETDRYEEIKRTAGSVFFTLDRQQTYFTSKFEVRIDKGQEKVEQYVTVNRYIQQLSLAHTVYGKFNYTQSRDETHDLTLQRFIESGVGYAYRPVFNDRWNLLSRYTYLVDLDKRQGIPEPKNEKSHIVEAETIFDINAYFDVGSKVAWKKRSDSFWRESNERLMIHSNIYLLAVSCSWHVIKQWDLMVEYHWKKDQEQDNVAQGSLVSVNKLLGNHFKLGIGYNFSRFDDDLVHRDNYDAQGFFINLLGTF